MNYKKLKQFYMLSPTFFKKAYSYIPWPIRMGRAYRITFDFLTNSETWTQDQWHAYQTKELKNLLQYCNEYIPYYQELFITKKINVNSEDIWDEFYKIPLMLKEELVKNKDMLIPRNGKNKLFTLATGGTTGKPVIIYYDKESFKKEWAFKMFFWQKAIGYKISDKKATFRGVSFSSTLFYENPIYNEIRFSPFKLEGSSIQKIVDKLKDYEPKYLHGYPSALEQIAKYLDENNEMIAGIEGIILISENIFDYQIALLEKTFNCAVYSFYGLSERVIMASMDSSCDVFYAHPAYGITEIVDENGDNIVEPGILGELVGTGFINYGMPLLRYRTADFSFWQKQINSIWKMPVLGAIKGRWNQEFLIGKDLSKISLTALNMHSNIYDEINKFQFYQEMKGIVQLNIVKEKGYTIDDEKNIRKEMMEKLGSQFSLNFNYVNHLELTQSGKSKYLIQNLDM